MLLFVLACYGHVRLTDSANAIMSGGVTSSDEPI